MFSRDGSNAPGDRLGTEGHVAATGFMYLTGRIQHAFTPHDVRARSALVVGTADQVCSLTNQLINLRLANKPISNQLILNICTSCQRPYATCMRQKTSGAVYTLLLLYIARRNETLVLPVPLMLAKKLECFRLRKISIYDFAVSVRFWLQSWEACAHAGAQRAAAVPARPGHPGILGVADVVPAEQLVLPNAAAGVFDGREQSGARAGAIGDVRGQHARQQPGPPLGAQPATTGILQHTLACANAARNEREPRCE